MSAAAQRQRTAGARKEAILAHLQRIFPNGLRTHELVEEHGWCARTRIVELRADGWQIPEEFDAASGEAVYRLASLNQGEPAPEIVEACKILVLSNRSVVVEPYAQGDYSADLAEAFEGEAVDRLVARFKVDPTKVDFVRAERGRGVVISLVDRKDRKDPDQDWFEFCTSGALG